jgi:hypothetical protein
MRGGVFSLVTRAAITGVAAETVQVQEIINPALIPGLSTETTCLIVANGVFTGSGTATLRIRYGGTVSATDGTVALTLTASGAGTQTASATFTKPAAAFFLKLTLVTTSTIILATAGCYLARNA